MRCNILLLSMWCVFAMRAAIVLSAGPLEGQNVGQSWLPLISNWNDNFRSYDIPLILSFHLAQWITEIVKLKCILIPYKMRKWINARLFEKSREYKKKKNK